MNEIVEHTVNFYKESAWIFHIFGIVFATLLTNFIWRRYFDKVMTKLAKTKNPWDDALWLAIHKPVGFLIWIVGISFAAEISKSVADPE